MRDSRQLDEEPIEPPPDPPLVSVIVPARNEARNIARCVSSVLATTYPRLEVVIVDDHSSDGTAAIAHDVAERDARVRVLASPPLPDGWFGKQWACATGAAAARGTILCFADADTWQAPDLIVRAVHAMHGRDADMLSVAGRQELGSFWERIVQPQIFSMLALRYGGTEVMARSARVHDKIANGQCIFVRRVAYDKVSGHAAVRDVVADDLMLAQRFHAAGKRVSLVLGVEQLSTRMYTSLAELIRGWRKNLFAGGRHAVPFGRAGRAMYPLTLLAAPLFSLAPPLTLGAALLTAVSPTVILWAAIASAALLLWWATVDVGVGISPVYSLGYPLGAAVLLYVSVQAIARGSVVDWKGRVYVAR